MSSARAVRPGPPASPRPPGSPRRDRILHAARVVFSRGGYRRANLDEVRRLAGVSKATLYQEFGSKDGLLLAVATTGIEELRDHIIAALATAGTPREAFGRAIRSALAFFDQHRGLAHILFLEASALQRELFARYFERYEASKPAAGAAFRACARPGLLARRSAGELADVLMYLIAGRVLIWLVRDEPARLEAEADLLFDVYARGVFAGEAAA